MAEIKTLQDKDLDMPCKHKNHTSLKHIGLKLICQDSWCKRPLRPPTHTHPRAVSYINRILPSLFIEHLVPFNIHFDFTSSSIQAPCWRCLQLPARQNCFPKTWYIPRVSTSAIHRNSESRMSDQVTGSKIYSQGI